MPELPEVETVRQGIAPPILGKTIVNVLVREERLRWPITTGLKKKCCGKKMTHVDRRGKYLLLRCDEGVVLIHLGMSGRLCLVSLADAPKKHDHVDIQFEDGIVLRFTDPRRFGAILWVEGDPLLHPLLVKLGPEPLEKDFDHRFLFKATRNKKIAIKNLIMDSHVVVGVGNIYANESLFLANIHPLQPAKNLRLEDCHRLVQAIRQVLRTAIKSGGTTLRDFVSADGKPGYFQQKLHVYGRDGLPCTHCGEPLKNIRIGNRSTIYCDQCQILPR